jgi:N-acetylmuramoyl-L-alanine amidase
MKITDHFSPNFEARTARVDTLVIHYTDMLSASEAIERLCDPEAKVSAHYLISKEGDVFRLVPEDKTAYHAGVSHWRGRASLNQSSIGIELDNLGHTNGPEAFSEVQMQSLFTLIASIRSRHEIPDCNIVAHSDIAPDRKKDPGELFPWDLLHAEGHGIWEKISKEPLIKEDVSFEIIAPIEGEDFFIVQKDLLQIGYKVRLTGEMDLETAQALTAFQRHFLPLNVTGILDSETLKRLEKISRLYG